MCLEGHVCEYMALKPGYKICKLSVGYDCVEDECEADSFCFKVEAE